MGGHRFRVIIRIRVEYFIYGRADRKVNNAITFEQSVFSEIYVSSKYHADSVGTMFGQLSSD